MVVHYRVNAEYHRHMVAVAYISHRARLAQRIRETRIEQGYSTRNFATMVGISKSYLYDLERAQASPTFDMLERIAAGLDMPVHELVNFEYRGD